MRSLAVDSYCEPVKFKLSNLPTPSISTPTDVLIKVHAGSINPGDLNIAAGLTRLMFAAKFPYKIGHDLSGTVIQVGASVTEIAVGDDVYTSLPLADGGSCPAPCSGYSFWQWLSNPVRSCIKLIIGSVSEYALTSWKNIARKPVSLSHIEVASLPVVALTALQAFQSAVDTIPGGLSGKTVMVPAGLSGTGSIGLQLAKHVYGAAKVITTVSTSKVPQIDQLLGKGTVDQIIDYTKQDVLKEVESRSVDFLFDTVGTGMASLALVKPKTGIVISISNIPPGNSIARIMPKTPWLLRRIFDAVDFFNRKRATRWSVKWECRLMELNVGDLDRVSQLVEEGKIRAIVGRTAKLSELQEIRDACTAIKAGKGGVGKFVVDVQRGAEV